MYQEIIEEIALEIVANKDLYQNNYGLYSGLTGSAMFLYEYAKINQAYTAHIESFIDAAFASIENSAPYATYCAGLAGACTGINFVCKDLEDEQPFEFVSEEIDDYLYSEYMANIKDHNLDFLHGAVGIAFYYLERLRSGDETFRKPLNTLLQYLEQHAIREHNQVKWKQQDGKNSEYNISLSHGLTSIVILLSELLITGGNYKVDIRALLSGVVNYILDQQIDADLYGSLFPYASTEVEIKGSRLAWCYGDLGIAIGIRKAATALADQALADKATAIFDYCAGRRNLIENMVLDTSVCHGSSGIALIYHDLYLKTGKALYQETAHYWTDQTSRLYQEKKIFHLTETNLYDTQRLSVLEGKAGVALTLLSVHYNIASDWQKFLLI